MTNAQHTPGPLVIDACPDFSKLNEVINRADGKKIGSVTSIWVGVEEAHANARLWAAAPDLLTESYRNLGIMRSCLELVKLFHKDSVQRDILELQIKATSAAITKAKGE